MKNNIKSNIKSNSILWLIHIIFVTGIATNVNVHA